MPNLATMTIEETQEAIRAEAIAQQNDRFRRGICGYLDHPDDKSLSILSGKIVYTPGIAALGLAFLADARKAIAHFDAFTEDNDPYGTHDFAAQDIPHEGATVKIFWKIDAYDVNYVYGSNDPADPQVTRRVLTIFLPSEY